MQIVNCVLADQKVIFDLYDQAIEFQKTKSDKHWPKFDAALGENEIREKRLWKIVADNKIACLFSVTYTDPLIWKEKNAEPAMYIHRIVANPLFRGHGFIKIIVEWARAHARDTGKKVIRMDTWGDNQKLIDYYASCGFIFLGVTTATVTKELPKHYIGTTLALFEIKL